MFNGVFTLSASAFEGIDKVSPLRLFVIILAIGLVDMCLLFGLFRFLLSIRDRIVAPIKQSKNITVNPDSDDIDDIAVDDDDEKNSEKEVIVLPEPKQSLLETFKTELHKPYALPFVFGVCAIMLLILGAAIFWILNYNGFLSCNACTSASDCIIRSLL